MALDQVCVVTPSNPRQCQNQDVIFLGTGTFTLNESFVCHVYICIAFIPELYTLT